VAPRAEPNASLPRAARSRVMRALAHGIVWVLAALLAYAVWRGYQNPDLLLDFSGLRLC
jgi:hypothetical protein